MLLHCELMNVLLIPGFLSHILPPGQAGVRMRWRVHMCVRALSVRHSISHESSMRLDIKGSRRGKQEGDTSGTGHVLRGDACGDDEPLLRGGDGETESCCCLFVTYDMMREYPSVAGSHGVHTG